MIERSRPSRLAVGALAAALAASAAAKPAGAAPASPGPEPPRARVRLSFDLDVPSELVRLIEGKVIDDDSLDAWVDLPGNAEVLRVGIDRGVLDRERLRENLWHAILGHRTRRGEGLGGLAFDPLEDLEAMLTELTGRREEIRRRVAERVAPYMPAGASDVDAVVRAHLGGTWDGRARGDIFLNLSFFHRFSPPWADAVEGILAHEVTHLVHGQFDSPPGQAETPAGLFAVALAQIHSEGMARHVESGLLEGEYAPGTYAAFAQGAFRDGLAGFTAAVGRLEAYRETCLRRKDSSGCWTMIQEGVRGGGELYAIGHGMARAIERARGRGSLASTFEGGPARFFELYVQASRMTPGLPPLGLDFESDLAEAAKHLAGTREQFLLRREARLALGRGEPRAAEAALRKLFGLDATNPITAYNLACALALQGESGGAVEWLERAVDLGYSDRAHMEADPDLDSLRATRGYLRLLVRLGAPPGPTSEPEPPAAPNADRK